MEEADLPEPIPAATLVLMRERASGPPEVLVTERTGNMAFAAGALVFPGGRIDADDHCTAEQLGVDAAKVGPEATFGDDLDADSLDLVELVMALEEEFDIEIPDEDAEQIKTVEQAISYIDGKAGA